nr:reverse transcriptase domain-containing protein [Tanacetum cinerariifolium]GEY25031.1 reverse transcriptase domain-containing protein [Tanacetum cinerariifolium]
MPPSDAALREYCDKNYHQLLPIIAEKVHQEKVQQENVKAVKAHLNSVEVSQHSKSGTSSKKRDLRKRLRSRRVRSMSESPEPRRGQPESPKKKDPERKTVFKRLEKEKRWKLFQKAKVAHEDTGSQGQKSKDQASRVTICPSHGVWFEDLSSESVDSYDDLKEAFLEYFCQQKKCIKYPMEIHHIKQKEGESTEDFVHRFKVESRDVKGAPEIMRISGFMHGIRNPKLIKWLHDKISKSVDEMMRITTPFLGGGGGCDIFTLLSKSPKEILALENGNFKALPPLTTPVEKRNSNKFCKFHREVGHNTDECMHLKRQLEELLKNGKLSHKVARQRIAQSFSPNPKISFPPLEEEEGFSGEIIWPLGKLSLLVKIGDAKHLTSALMNFVVVRSSSLYNKIIKRPRFRKIQAVPSIAYGMIKFSVVGGVITLKSNKIIPIECAAVSRPEGQPSAAHQAIEERIEVEINPDYPEQTIMIGSTLIKEGRNKLCDLLQHNLDVFSWNPTDMNGFPRDVVEHRLNIQEGCPPVRQKRRTQAAERNQAIQEEVEKLIDASIMKEVHYHSWLSNLVMVKKHDDSWRMSIDFKDLNKGCPKDGYPLLKIDWKVESLCGFPFKFFMDAYKGYQQIKMAKEDEEKRKFITSQGVFCYSNMPFGLRNAGATYQRLVDKAFHKQIDRNLEVYMDALIIKSRTEDEIIRDIKETFKTLREINMKLNLKKCTFGVEEGMFLGYKVNTKGIKLIAELPTLTAPAEKEELIVYLAIAKEAMSAVLMTEREAKQMPIYFGSHTLRGPEVNYTSMEKIGFSAEETLPAEVNKARAVRQAVIPAEIGMPTLRTAEVDIVKNNEALEINLDLLEERRDQVAIREAKRKARIEKYYNSKSASQVSSQET